MRSPGKEKMVESEGKFEWKREKVRWKWGERDEGERERRES